MYVYILYILLRVSTSIKAARITVECRYCCSAVAYIIYIYIYTKVYNYVVYTCCVYNKSKSELINYSTRERSLAIIAKRAISQRERTCRTIQENRLVVRANDVSSSVHDDDVRNNKRYLYCFF